MWLGVLFGLGSLCFAAGSVPLYFANVPPAVVGWTFVAGSLCFTTAAALQLAGTPRASRVDWWAGAVQLVGTVCFNVSTLAATRGLEALQARRLVWVPDVYGSVCFLVASAMAWLAVRSPGPGGALDRRVAVLNLAGSVAFGLAAVAARYVVDTTVVANVALVNLGTFAGAVCFLAGAALLPVASARTAGTGGPGGA
ncbi:hypothetical protein [Cellulomonas sp. Marseille-Q8402]